jgi:cytochrome-b5 reductase
MLQIFTVRSMLLMRHRGRLFLSTKTPALFQPQNTSPQHTHRHTHTLTPTKDLSQTIPIPNASIESMMSYQLVEKSQDKHDTCHLRFALPDGRDLLGEDPTLPTCIFVQYNGVHESSGEPAVLQKSYSPISHPQQKGTFDLLVKGYPLRPGGGVGAYLCGLQVGESIQAAVKANKIVHSDAHVLGRWKSVGLVAGGTGIAPLFQLAKIFLESKDSDEECQIKLLSIHRTPDDILLRRECDELAAKYPHRFQVTYSLTGDNVRDEEGAWVRDRGSVELVKRVLPDPASKDGECMLFVCGKDGFVSHWGGPVTRGLAPPGKQKKKAPKVQGPLLGILKDAGYESYQVFKY